MKPGDTFSLNDFTGPREAAQGYVEAGIIEDGVPDRGIGGGISQFSTTLYNATYFAGLDEVEHKEHSYYISRYPAGREATVFDGVIDLKFRNDGPTPILIRTLWTPSSIKVQILGQKRFDVTSQTGPRTDPVPAGVRNLPEQPEVQALEGRRRLHDHRHPGAQGREDRARRRPSPGPSATTRSPRSPATSRPCGRISSSGRRPHPFTWPPA